MRICVQNEILKAESLLHRKDETHVCLKQEVKIVKVEGVIFFCWVQNCSKSKIYEQRFHPLESLYGYMT